MGDLLSASPGSPPHGGPPAVLSHPHFLLRLVWSVLLLYRLTKFNRLPNSSHVLEQKCLKKVDKARFLKCGLLFSNVSKNVSSSSFPQTSLSEKAVAAIFIRVLGYRTSAEEMLYEDEIETFFNQCPSNYLLFVFTQCNR